MVDNIRRVLAIRTQDKIPSGAGRNASDSGSEDPPSTIQSASPSLKPPGMENSSSGPASPNKSDTLQSLSTSSNANPSSTLTYIPSTSTSVDGSQLTDSSPDSLVTNSNETYSTDTNTVGQSSSSETSSLSPTPTTCLQHDSYSSKDIPGSTSVSPTSSPSTPIHSSTDLRRCASSQRISEGSKSPSPPSTVPSTTSPSGGSGHPSDSNSSTNPGPTSTLTSSATTPLQQSSHSSVGASGGSTLVRIRLSSSTSFSVSTIPISSNNRTMLSMTITSSPNTQPRVPSSLKYPHSTTMPGSFSMQISQTPQSINKSPTMSGTVVVAVAHSSGSGNLIITTTRTYITTSFSTIGTGTEQTVIPATQTKTSTFLTVSYPTATFKSQDGDNRGRSKLPVILGPILGILVVLGLFLCVHCRRTRAKRQRPSIVHYGSNDTPFDFQYQSTFESEEMRLTEPVVPTQLASISGVRTPIHLHSSSENPFNDPDVPISYGNLTVGVLHQIDWDAQSRSSKISSPSIRFAVSEANSPGSVYAVPVATTSTITSDTPIAFNSNSKDNPFAEPVPSWPNTVTASTNILRASADTPDMSSSWRGPHLSSLINVVRGGGVSSQASTNCG